MSASDDRVASTLAEIRGRGYRNGATGAACARLSDAAAVDIPVLLAAVEAALKRHRKSMLPASLGEHRGRHYCAACTSAVDDFVDYVDWPCEEYRAITTALTEETPDG